MIRLLAAAALAAALILAGCADSRSDIPAPARKPGLRWEHFGDIPMPAGWQAMPGEDQIAMAIGNGAVRRLRISLVAPAGRGDLQPPEAIARWVGHALPEAGWLRDPEGRATDLVQRWRKGDEVLDVNARREGGLVVLRWALVVPPLP